MNAIDESKISAKVWADSAIRAVLPENVPIIKLKIARIAFPEIPTIIAFLPSFSLSLESKNNTSIKNLLRYRFYI
jgi:hypothetical protein